jgi:flagellin-like protein
MNKTLRKIRHDAKALSPVVASIILIAVTVAVSIAVAAWMGGMTIGFMGSSSITVTNVNFATNATGTDELNYIVLTLKNTGTKTVTIAAIRINNQVISDMLANSTTVTPAESSLVWINPAADVPGMAMNAGNTATLTLSTRNMLAQWVNGNPYKIDLYDGSNQVIGSAQQNAPGA